MFSVVFYGIVCGTWTLAVAGILVFRSDGILGSPLAELFILIIVSRSRDFVILDTVSLGSSDDRSHLGVEVEGVILSYGRSTDVGPGLVTGLNF